ncbi:MAG: hypothetical protein A2075_03830 [Geobacteraceae bacterium GWC2_58_44]|nr:MAG: hypothetical protein A2075_03830 [Geobacteraceae bacterium GWC2_58_44]HBG07525.1 TlpA family protein disulfide reductase [Geobacter sp.]
MPALFLPALLLCSGCDEKRGVKIGENPPAVSGKDLQGRSVDLAHLKGKVVVIYFWTNSCCGDTLKELEPVYLRNKNKGLEILAINVMDSRKDVASIASNNRLTFTMLPDEHATLFEQYKVRGFPTIFILDKHGVVREKILGAIHSSKLEKLMQRQFEIHKQAEDAYQKARPH